LTHPIRILPIYAAARLVVEACAERLTAALHRGEWRVQFQVRLPGAPVETAALSVLTDMLVQVATASLSANLAMIKGVRPPPWLLPTGRRTALLFKRAPAAEAPQVNATQAADGPPANERPLSPNKILARRLAEDVWAGNYKSVNKAALKKEHWEAWISDTANEASKQRALRNAITEYLKETNRWPLEKRSPKISRLLQ
jgi:hypothetical protein